jgi:dienelactone hydrolase
MAKFRRSTSRYGNAGKEVELFVPEAPSPPLVVMWHGRSPNDRGALVPLAERVATDGAFVVVPDWDSGSTDRGRSDLVASLDFAVQAGQRLADSIEGFVLAGWSLGGMAAIGLALQPESDSTLRPGAVVCIAAGYVTPMPTGGVSAMDGLSVTTADPVPIWIVHGTRDDVVPASGAKGFVDGLQQIGWSSTLTTLDADHESIIGLEHDERSGMGIPGTSEETQSCADRVAHVIKAALSHSSD